mmetsp:Transcript_120675/g.313334  ORF Transcript_120675/g.313334 Transcript_120675/m.313334 type:complete len:214 (+) Transcript_120675:67-708(+)
MAASLQFQQVLFRVLGAVASGLFAVQAIWIFMQPPSANLWKICHWLGQGLLCLLAGAAGCYLEVKGGRALVEAQLTKFTANRVLLSVFYFWLGCYVMDISNFNFWQEMLAHVTGILAWVVSAGNLVVSCACGAVVDKDEPEGHPQQLAAPPPVSTKAPLKAAPITSVAGSAGAGVAGVGAVGLSNAEADVEKGEEVAPPGGWNSTWTNQYGNA